MWKNGSFVCMLKQESRKQECKNGIEKSRNAKMGVKRAGMQKRE